MRLYVHGAGRAGSEAWPAQEASGAVFADHSRQLDMSSKARAVVEQAPSNPLAVVAHSLGATVVAVALEEIRPQRLVLVEPALYDIARGHEAIEGHVGQMTRAREHAAAGDLYGYWEIVSPMMFGLPASRDRWEEEQDRAEWMAAIEPPWGHGLTAGQFGDVPTLVVTGDWNQEYEAVATRLTEVGARHVHLPGYQHRPQDHPDFNGLVEEFIATG
jgi:hypothetical protein